MISHHRCPEPEVIAALVAGALSDEEVLDTLTQVESCHDCKAIVRITVYVDGKLDLHAQPAFRPQRRTRRWLPAVAAAAVVAIVSTSILLTQRWSKDPFDRLVAAASSQSREFEPRVSGGFRWAPMRPVLRGSGEFEAGRMKLIGAAGEVIEETAHDDSLDARHAAAVAHLIAGNTREALVQLKELAKSTGNPRVWNDLAAALYVASIAGNEPIQLAEALAAVDTALRIKPGLPEALFNRALIVESLGLRDHARAAWKRYLDADTSSPWAKEARKRLSELGPVTQFRDEFERDYERLQRDSAAARQLAQRYPQDARVWGESEILARWAASVQSGDAAAAAAHLSVARAFAQETTARGDAMLAQAIATIDAADESSKRILAEAHRRFREAQRIYSRGQPREAERLFALAREGFRNAHSPFELAAGKFVANTVYDQGRIDEAATKLEFLLAATPREYPAHRAEIEWELGLIRAAQARWGVAIHLLKDSAETFDRLGETRSAGRMRSILAEVYGRIGQRRLTWQHHILALRDVGTVALDAAAQSAANDREWPLALALLDLQLEQVDGSIDDFRRANLLLRRARIKSLVGHAESATADLSQAGKMIAEIPDASMRERVEADYQAVQAVLTPSASDAVPLLTHAIEFHASKGRRIVLPELYLQRGRAFTALKRAAHAANDFEMGIREVEAQRVNRFERWEADTAQEELFEAAIDLAVSRGDVREAFAYTERARELRLLEEMAARSTTVKPAAISGDTILEYMVLPSRLLIFMVRNDEIRVVQSDVTREVLSREIQSLTATLAGERSKEFRKAASVLYRRLLAPVDRDITTAHTLVIVPDPMLDSVPFSALVAPDGRYAVEKHAVVVAPSAGRFAALKARHRSLASRMDLLLVTGPSGRNGELGLLFSAQREAAAISAIYGDRVRLVSKEDERFRFERQASNVDIIHFAGHGTDPDYSGEAALVTSKGAEESGLLEARDIAHMDLGRTQLVVLAACSTAREGNDSKTKLSVAQAFLYAGVPSVVATLWPIEDELAAKFFPRLHQRLVQGASPEDALRGTQLEWIRSGAPPAMWAAVQVIGSSRPVVAPKAKMSTG